MTEANDSIKYDLPTVQALSLELNKYPALTLDQLLGYPIDRLPLYFEYRKFEQETP